MGLVLRRSIGEQISFFKKPGVFVVTLTAIEFERAFLDVEHIHNETFTLRLGRGMQGRIDDDISIKVTGIGKGWCKIGINAPDSVTILRSELEEE